MSDRTHQPHPRCSCKRPLYKSFEKGARVKREDPYRFCRNKACEGYGAAGVRVVKNDAPTAAERPPVRARVSRAKRATKPKGEPAVIQKARKRIAALVKEVRQDAPASAVGLVLALVTQETGDKAAANALILQHKLDEKFGLLPQ